MQSANKNKVISISQLGLVFKGFILVIVGLCFSFQFPLSDLVRILAFESLDEAAQFCRHHGLQITQELLTVDRSSFVRPETAIGAVRAMNIIESKLTVSPGEVSAMTDSLMWNE